MTNNNNRLREELLELQEDPPHKGWAVNLVDETNYLKWTATIMGREGGAFEGGMFILTLTFNDSYPGEPPEVHFRSRMYHPNVESDTGRICLNILGEDEWKPTDKVKTVLSAVQWLLDNPNARDAVNPEAASCLTNFPEDYKEEAKKVVEESLVEWEPLATQQTN